MGVKMLVLVVCVAMAPLGGPVFAQRPQPPRLVVINYTGAVVDVSAFAGDRWQARGRLNPGASLPIAGVKDGDRFRAVWPGGSAEHAVQLHYDAAYGALQDTWTVQR